MKTIIALIMSLIIFPLLLIGQEAEPVLTEADTGLEIDIGSVQAVEIVPAVVENIDKIYIKLVVVDIKKKQVYSIMEGTGKRIELVTPDAFDTHPLVTGMKSAVIANIQTQYPAQ